MPLLKSLWCLIGWCKALITEKKCVCGWGREGLCGILCTVCSFFYEPKIALKKKKIKSFELLKRKTPLWLHFANLLLLGPGYSRPSCPRGLFSFLTRLSFSHQALNFQPCPPKQGISFVWNTLCCFRPQGNFYPSCKSLLRCQLSAKPFRIIKQASCFFLSALLLFLNTQYFKLPVYVSGSAISV